LRHYGLFAAAGGERRSQGDGAKNEEKQVRFHFFQRLGEIRKAKIHAAMQASKDVSRWLTLFVQRFEVAFKLFFIHLDVLSQGVNQFPAANLFDLPSSSRPKENTSVITMNKPFFLLPTATITFGLPIYNAARSERSRMVFE
jgi:hypothetical protein